MNLKRWVAGLLVALGLSMSSGRVHAGFEEEKAALTAQMEEIESNPSLDPHGKKKRELGMQLREVLITEGEFSKIREELEAMMKRLEEYERRFTNESLEGYKTKSERELLMLRLLKLGEDLEFIKENEKVLEKGLGKSGVNKLKGEIATLVGGYRFYLNPPKPIKKNSFPKVKSKKDVS